MGRMLTYAEAAQIIGCGLRSVTRWVANGDLRTTEADCERPMLDESDVIAKAWAFRDAQWHAEKAPEQLAALTKAMEDSEPACLGNEWFTFDREDLDPEFRGQLAEVCTRCPIRDTCDAYAEAARPTGGMWAGRYYDARAPRARHA